jgi:hypothetical protein
MPNLNKKLLFTIIIIVIFITSVILFFVLIKSDKSEINQIFANAKFVDKNLVSEDITENELENINNKNAADVDKYESVLRLSNLVNNAYIRTSDTRYKDLFLILKNYASNNYPKQYKVKDFEIPCADASCGQQIPPTITAIISEIDGLNIDKGYKTLATSNLKNGAFASDKNEKGIKYAMAYNLLLTLGQADASASALKIKNFTKESLGFDL